MSQCIRQMSDIKVQNALRILILFTDFLDSQISVLAQSHEALNINQDSDISIHVYNTDSV